VRIARRIVAALAPQAPLRLGSLAQCDDFGIDDSPHRRVVNRRALLGADRHDAQVFELA
jgi:hypothetical protein